MISSLLFTDYRRRVLELLLLHPETKYHVREIARLTDTKAGTVHRELSKLAAAQVLLREQSGNQVYYQANQSFLIFDELVSILRKTSGLVGVLQNALTPLANRIDVAFVFGSIPRGTASTSSDVDILIIGEVSFAEVVTTLYPVQEILGREINPKVYQNSQWEKLSDSKDPFVEEIQNNPKYFIIGVNNDIKQSSWKKP